ncbi:MAG: peptidoglycan-binding protein [Acidobacteriaceae bacterium]|nr:peptidoglycan-binding protein [Acidobacteriaceae bacterium]MBV9778501.1 peptidoglycan-binding protein [Acidobacteriaceae bacterium]
METLQLGSTGPEVEELQRALAAAGFDPDTADGSFGPETRKAVIAFQTKRGLIVDGLVGPQTAAALGLAGTEEATLPTR